MKKVVFVYFGNQLEPVKCGGMYD